MIVFFVWLVATLAGLWMAWTRVGPFLRSANSSEKRAPPSGGPVRRGA